MAPNQVKSAIVGPTQPLHRPERKVASVKITPQSIRASSQANPQEDNINVYLLEDLKGRLHLSFDDFLDVILRFSPDDHKEFSVETRTKLDRQDTKSDAFRDSWKQYESTYKAKGKKEKDLYPVLVDVLNKAMGVLFEGGVAPLTFYNGADATVRGAYTERKPDIGVMLTRHGLGEGFAKDLHKRWPMLAYFVEVKRRKGGALYRGPVIKKRKEELPQRASTSSETSLEDAIKETLAMSETRTENSDPVQRLGASRSSSRATSTLVGFQSELIDDGGKTGNNKRKRTMNHPLSGQAQTSTDRHHVNRGSSHSRTISEVTRSREARAARSSGQATTSALQAEPAISTSHGSSLLTELIAGRPKVETTPPREHHDINFDEIDELQSDVEVAEAGDQKRQKGVDGSKIVTGSVQVAPPGEEISVEEEDKLNESQIVIHTLLQCAGYGLEMLSASSLRSYSIGLVVDDQFLQLAYYDRSKVALSEPINMFDNKGQMRLLAVLHQLARLPYTEHGPFPSDALRPFTSKGTSSKDGTIGSDGTSVSDRIVVSDEVRSSDETAVSDAANKCAVSEGIPVSDAGDKSAVSEEIPVSGSADAFPRIHPNFNEAYVRNNTTQDKQSAPSDEVQPGYDAFLGCTLTLEKDVELELMEVIYRAHGILGRGTTVLRAKCSLELREKWKHDSNEVIVKISFPGARRHGEDEICAKALQTAHELGDDYSWVKNNLPNILYSKTYKNPKDMPQSRIYSFLQRMGRDPEQEYEIRKLRITVQEALAPITDLINVVEYAQAFFDILQVHRWLVDYPKILHRDISLANIMFRRKDRVYGVLNDFDLASILPPTGDPTSQQRTGTKPYMCHELLQESWLLGHLYRHDLEALFYVLLTLCCHHEQRTKNGPVRLRSRKQRQFDRWWTDNNARVRENKHYMLTADPCPFHLSSFFKPFKKCLRRLFKGLRKGYFNKSAYMRNVDDDEDSDESESESDSDLKSGSESGTDPASSDGHGKARDFDWHTLGKEVTYKFFRQCMRRIAGHKLIVSYKKNRPLRHVDFEPRKDEDVTMEQV